MVSLRRISMTAMIPADATVKGVVIKLADGTMLYREANGQPVPVTPVVIDAKPKAKAKAKPKGRAKAKTTTGKDDMFFRKVEECQGTAMYHPATGGKPYLVAILGHGTNTRGEWYHVCSIGKKGDWAYAKVRRENGRDCWGWFATPARMTDMRWF